MNENNFYLLIVGIVALVAIVALIPGQLMSADTKAGYASYSESELSCSVDQELCDLGVGKECGFIVDEGCMLKDGSIYYLGDECVSIDLCLGECSSGVCLQ